MKKILCPIDFSENSLEAAAFAIRFAHLSGSQLKFLYVSSIVIPVGGIVDVEMPIKQLELKNSELEDKIAEIYAKEALPFHTQNVICETVDDISIVGGIAQEAKRNGADLIIMGTTGASDLKRLFIGSVTTSVLDQVDCPVLAVPSEFGGRKIRKIGMPTDVIYVENEIGEAVQFAQIFGAEINLFHVSVRQPDSEKLEEKLRFITGYSDISYTEIHPDFEGDVLGSLNDYVEKYQPDLLIMHHGKKSWFDKLISGSRTKDMIFQSKTAVLTFKKEHTE